MTARSADSPQSQPAAPFPPRTRVTIDGRQWLIDGRPVHAGTPAEGLLTNVRMVNAIFEDTGPAARNLPAGFDPEANAQRFIDRLPAYVASGVAAFTIGLQGGLPGYEGAVNSGFQADGSLREAYMARAARVIEAADRAGAVIILSCFYQRQHSHERALAGREAIRRAVANVARWIAGRGYTNVLLEIANEYRHSGFAKWADGDWLAGDAGQVELIRLAREAAPGLLVSTAGMGSGVVSEVVADEADFLLIHFNNTALADIPQRIADTRRHGKPVVCNEDNKVGPAGAEACRLAITSGAGWGFMHADRNQHVPFEFDGPADDPDVYRMFAQLTAAQPADGAARGAKSAPAPVASVLITEPRDGDTFRAGQAVAIRIAVTHGPGQSTARVDVLADGRRIASASAAPWHLTWEQPAAGSYNLVAIQFDGAGRPLARSPVVDVVVRD